MNFGVCCGPDAMLQTLIQYSGFKDESDLLQNYNLHQNKTAAASAPLSQQLRPQSKEDEKHIGTAVTLAVVPKTVPELPELLVQRPEIVAAMRQHLLHFSASNIALSSVKKSKLAGM